MGSNASAAASASTLDVATDVLFVSILGAAAYQMGIINALGSAAFLLLAVPIGILIDRSHPLRILRISQAVLIGLLAALLVLQITGVLTIWLGMVVVALTGICSTAIEASRQSLAPRLIEYDEHRSTGISRFVSRLTSVDQTVRIAAPAAAGLAITALGVPVLIGVSIALLGIALLFLVPVQKLEAPAAALTDTEQPADTEQSTDTEQPTESATPDDDDAPTSPPNSSRRGEESLWRTLTAGFRELAALPQLLAITLLIAGTNAALGFGAAVEVIFLLQFLGLGPALFGAAVSAGAVGGLLGALAGPWLLRRWEAPSLVVIGTCGQVAAASFYVLAVFVPYPVAVCLVFAHSVLWGLCVVAASVASMGWAASLMPESHFARISTSRRMLTMGVVPIAGLLGGASGSLLGIVPTLITWPVITTAALLAYLVMRSRHSPAS